MSDISHEISVAAPTSASSPWPRIHRILPQAMVGIGLGLTVAWVCFLSYGLVELIRLVI